MSAKEEQRNERDFIDSIFKTAPVIILVLDDKGRVVTFNPYLEKISGYKLDEVKGKYWFDIFIPDRERDRIRGVFKDASREIETTGTINPILTRDGREVMIEWSNRPIKDNEGNLVRILAVGQDITERMLIEDALRESEERFRRLSDAAEEGIVIHDQGVIVDANEAMARMFGYELTELIGMYGEKLATPETWQTALDNIATGYDKPHEGIAVRKDGSTFACQIVGKPYQYQGRTLRVAAFRDITILKKTEEALRESEEKYRLVVENAGEGIAVYQDGELKYFNRKMAEIPGYTEEEYASIDIITLLHPDDKEITLERYKMRHRGEEVPSSYEIRILCKNGKTKWVTVIPVIMTWQDKPANLVFVVDITERKHAEEALKQSEASLGSILRAAPIGIGMVSNRVLMWVNDRLCAMTGYAAHELKGKSARMLYRSDEEFEHVGREKYADIEKFGTGSVETQWIRKDGSVRDILLSSSAIDPSDLSAGVIFTADDITDRKEAEVALKESEQKFSKAFQSGPTLMAISTVADGRFIEVNEEFLRSLGYKREEVIGKTSSELGIFVDFNQRGWVMQQVLEKGSVRDVEITVLTKSGEERYGSFSADIIQLQNRQYLMTVMNDITERKQAVETMVRLQKLESLSILAGGIAHDFNNLLMGILGYAELAKAELGPESPGRNSVERIEESALLAADITKQMLAYSGKGKFVIEPINLSKLIEEMTHLLEAVVAKKSVLKFNLEGELPAVDADATQLRQVVLNLVTNASEAIGDRSGVINVTTGVMECDADYLVATYLKEEMEVGIYSYLEVSDTGCGMDEEMRAKIFDPFFTTKFTGRGLGLAAVLGIIRGHNGAIKVDSTPGRGSTFRLLFPISSGIAKEKADMGEHPVDSRISGTILVVDDEESIRALAKLVLGQSGVKVLTAEDGRKGVEIFRKHQDEISVVLLDMTMPHKGGEETFDEIRKIRKDVRVILSSGYNEQQVTSNFVGKGLAGFIQKPYRPSELIEKLRQLFKD